jgi:hypothetical protein
MAIYSAATILESFALNYTGVAIFLTGTVLFEQNFDEHRYFLFDFNKIFISKKFEKFCFSLDPDPD